MTDEEYLGQISKVEIYCEILLGFLRYTNIRNYQTEEEQIRQLTKKLKFQNPYDYDLFRACIDQLEDAQYAIIDFLENGLYIKEKNQGEMYLRLYGVLNACYLQFGVLVDLIRLFNFPNQKEIRTQLKNTDAIKLRNKIGSHSTGYIDQNNNFNYFKITQSSLDKKGNDIVLVRNGSKVEHVNLTQNIINFQKSVEYYLEQIISKELYSRTFKREAFEWMKFRHDFIRNLK